MNLESLEKRLRALGFDDAAVNMRILLAAERPRRAPYEKLLRELDASLKKSPSARLHALKGKVLSNLARYPEARAALERSLGLDGGQAAARAWLGGALLLEGKVAEAAAELDRAAALDARCAWALFYRAANRLVMGEESAARADLARILAIPGDDEAATAARAFLCLLELKAARFGAARRYLAPALKRRAQEGWPFLLRAAVSRAAGRKKDALKDYATALKRSPADWIYLERAALREELGDAKGALRDVQSALRLAPAPALFLRRAELHASAGRFDLAVRDLHRALPRGAAAPDARAFALELAGKLRGRGEDARALKLLRRASAAFPNDADLLAGMVQLESAGHGKEAERLLRAARRRAPSSGAVADLLAGLLENSGRGEEAVALLRDAARADAKAGARLAQLLLRRGLHDQADAALTAALALDPANAEAWRARARTRASQGRLDEALAAAEKALALTPQDLDAAFAVADLLLRLGRAGEVPPRLESHRRGLAGAADPDGLLRRFDAAILCLDFDDAADSGEKILDATRGFAHLNRLFRPFFRDEFDFLTLPRSYKQKVFAELDAHLARHPGSAWGRYFRSVLTDMLGAGEPSAADLAALVALPPARYGWMRGHVGEHELIYKRDFPAAQKSFAAAARACEPGNWAAQCLLAEALICQGNAGWRRAFDEAEKMAPALERAEVLAWRGEFLLFSGHYAEALKNLDAAAAGRHSRFAQGWRGGALVMLGRYDEAFEAVGRAVAMVPHDAEARTWRVEALYRTRRFTEALAEADFALTRYARYCGFHLYALRGLVRAALNDEAGLRADYEHVPEAVRAYAIKSMRPAPALPSDAARVLEEILKLSLGVRRGGYENSIWMR